MGIGWILKKSISHLRPSGCWRISELSPLATSVCVSLLSLCDLVHSHILCCVFHIPCSLSHSSLLQDPSPLNSGLIDLLDLQSHVSDNSNLKRSTLNSCSFFSNQLLSQFYLSQERTNNTLLAVRNNNSPLWLLISSTTCSLSEMPICSTLKMQPRFKYFCLHSHTHLLSGFLQQQLESLFPHSSPPP